MNVLQNILMDVEALIDRLKTELDPHPLITQARQFIEGAAIELGKHPDAAPATAAPVTPTEQDSAPKAS